MGKLCVECKRSSYPQFLDLKSARRIWLAQSVENVDSGVVSSYHELSVGDYWKKKKSRHPGGSVGSASDLGS